ncbi:nephrin-like isoform X1 [Parasteatoda tepidariorum]|uniref:nephrin-like isoform X1 n=1 Tax=Parasteatoda tepidariorum TaxID=114398 RepID=UPI0039BCAC0B
MQMMNVQSFKQLLDPQCICHVISAHHPMTIQFLWFCGINAKIQILFTPWMLAADSFTADSAKHFSSKYLGSRAYFNVTIRNLGHLRLSPVAEEDAGEYRCRVDFKRGRTMSRWITLTIVVPVKKVVIKGKDNFSYSEIIGPFREGESVTLNCMAVGGFPTPTLTWLKDSKPVRSTPAFEDQRFIKSELVLHSLRREDLLTVLTCQASNSNITEPIETSITIDIILKPLNVLISTIFGSLKVGSKIEINCQSEGSRPPARISWRKGLENIDQLAVQNIYGSMTFSTLTFVPKIEDHNKTLTCEALNPKLPKSSLQDSWTLNILYPPQLTLVFGASVKQAHIHEGSDVYFECNIQSNPSITDIKWIFQDQTIAKDSFRGVSIRNHSLLLHSVDQSHKGSYRCEAFNSEGKGQSEEVLLKIYYTPICINKYRISYGVGKNENINVSCHVESDPEVIEFWWKFSNPLNETKEIGTFKNYVKKSKSVARYIPLNENDYGSLICYARNAVGIMRQPCIFEITPAGPPESLQNCTVSNQSYNSLFISCNEGYDGGRKQAFHLEMYSVKEEILLVNISSTDKPSFLVKGLPSHVSFIIIIYSSNSEGRCSSVALTATTLLSGETLTDKKSNVLGAVLIATLTVLVALSFLAVAAIVVVNRNKTNSISHEVRVPQNEAIEKSSKPTSFFIHENSPYSYHSTEFSAECIDLTSKTSPEFLYETSIVKSTVQYEISHV